MPPETRSEHWLQFSKAYLIASRQSAPRDHHLVSLLHRCVREGLRGRNLDRACKILDQYYIPTRYPDAVAGSLSIGLPSRVHAAEAIRLAEGILRSVQRRIS